MNNPGQPDRLTKLLLQRRKCLNLLPVLLETIRWGLSELENCGIPEMMKPLLDDGAEDYLVIQRSQLAEERAALHNA